MASSDLTNWAGNVRFSARAVHRPETVDELRALVAGSERLRVLGTGHSFSTVADTTGDLISVAGLPPTVDVDEPAGAARVAAGLRFGELAQVLDPLGWGLHNLGSLPHISVGGAVATGTHGSGVGNRNLAAAVAGLELVTADGELLTLRRGEPGFEGAVVTLGALGVVTHLTLDLEPAYEIEQRVYDDLPLAALRANLAEVLGAAYSVSAFLTWREPVGAQLWVKHRTDAGSWAQGSDWLGATLADGPRHPVPGIDPRSCTEQGGVPGRWHERLPHFRLDFTPSAGDELQTEYLLPIDQAGAALDALGDLAGLVAPVLLINELRTIAADELWLSEAYRQDSIAVHFTWLNDPVAVAPVIAAVERRLAPLGARPHWGKVFGMPPADVAARYPRFDDARALITGHDPKGKLRNAFVEQYLFGV